MLWLSVDLSTCAVALVFICELHIAIIDYGLSKE